MKKVLFILTLIPFLWSCTEEVITDLADNSLIPVPVDVSASGTQFTVTAKTQILFPGENAEIERLAGMTGDIFKSITAQDYTVASTEKRKSNSIRLELTEDQDLGQEGYILEVLEKEILIKASTSEGLFRAITTLQQLVWLKHSDVNIEEGRVQIPSGTIKDFPEYEYRGMMLDVSRHFFGVDDVKRLIDLLALYKINILHMHLSDDQGWRIEIKSWPRLTEIGGSTEVGGGEGGFYTQEEFRELVAYADSRYITIVPEIDMPGHTNAALASYAELNCNGKAPELYTGTKVGFSTLCTREENTYVFIDDVVREISEMITGPYFHMGGDESHVTKLDDYIYFVDRVKTIVNAHGKIMVGWDEISHGAINEGDISQYWASSENALRAIDKGSRLIISPAKKCYLDMKYNEETALGLNWAAYIEVDEAYQWDPVKLDDGIKRENIHGVESPLWAETIETFDDIAFLAFPRVIGHSEIGWSNSEALSWESYRERLAVHGLLLDELGVNFYKSPKVEW